MKRLAKFTNALMASLVAVCLFCLPSCNDKVQDSVTDLKASLEKQIANLQTQVDQINQDIDDLEDEIEDLTGYVDDQDKKLWEDLTDSIKSTKQELITILGDSLSNYWTIDEVQGYVNLVLQDYATKAELENAAKILQDQIDDAYKMINQNTTDIAALTKKYQEVANVASYAAALAKNDSIRINALETKTQSAVDSAAAALVLARNNENRIIVLEKAYSTLAQNYNELKKTDEDLKAADKKLQEQIDSVANALANYATKADLKAVSEKADALYAKAIAYSDSLYNLSQKQLTALDGRVTTLETVTNTLSGQVGDLEKDLAALQKDVASLKDQVDANTKAISELTTITNSIKDVLTKSISSLLIQGTVNPVFGYYALPSGVQNNILIAYYGNNEHETFFPTTSTSDLVYEDYALTEEDAAMLGGTVDTWSIPGQTTFLSENANCGKLYLTVNPNTVDLSTTEFTLVNSQDEESPITLDSVVPSQDVLTFGYTMTAPARGHATNGFYEATATLTEDNIDAAKITVNEQLKQSVKDFYHQYIQRDGKTQTSFTTLAGSLYQQFNGILPAYAIKATWTDSLGEHSVYSNYELATTAVKPLSYAFFKDKSIKKLPTITPLSEFNADSFHFNIPELKFDINFKVDSVNMNIKLTDVKLDLSGVILASVRVPKNIEEYVDCKTGAGIGCALEYDTVTVELDSLEKTLNEQLNTQITKWNSSINDSINNQVNSLITQINKQVSDMTSDIEAQVNDYADDLMDTLSVQITQKMNNYVVKLNKYVTKVNNVINKINTKLLDNPNKFLQTIMFYKGKDGSFHLMSTSLSTPTVLNGVGTIVIYPSSYNAEIAAPAYKKFIAVTNVYRGDTSAQEGNAACINALQKANAQPNFNTVIDGGRYGVAFTTESTGYTYEIFYAALDYAGKISQRKYYITVQ